MRADFAAYRHFVANAPVPEDGYLFDTPRCRFAPEPSDRLLLGPGATRPPEVDQATWQAAERQLPCALSELTTTLGERTEAFVRATFGSVLFAPHALLSLELAQPSHEIVRFPGSPYEIVRPYWRNMGAVRRILETEPVPSSGAELSELIVRLHVLALTGDGRSFYLPASALARKRPTPGELYDVPSQLQRHGGTFVLLSGARVSAPLLGGEHYFRLLAESVGDPGALATERQLEFGGVPLGGIIPARAPDEAESRPWFVPPRPLSRAHFELLATQLRAADEAARQRDDAALVHALARFHYAFVRTHPLPSANQSLSMSFINARLRARFGSGIPHLLLDQLALRFRPDSYAQLFDRAVRSWLVVEQQPAARNLELSKRRRILDACVSGIAQAQSGLHDARAQSGLHDARAQSGLDARALALALLR
jgi:hypothetical protein